MATDYPTEPEGRVSFDGAHGSTLPTPKTLPVMIAVLALAFGLRVTMAVRTSVIFEDGPFFLDTAKLFARGDWAGAFAHPYHPLYSGLTAALERVVNDWEIAALSISVIGGTAAVLALFVFLRDSFDARSAARQPQARSRDAFIAAILVFYGVVLVGLLANYGYLSRRHVLPLLPLLLGYAGLGAGWLVDRVGNRSKNREAERPGRVPRLAPARLMAGLALLMFGIAAPRRCTITAKKSSPCATETGFGVSSRWFGNACDTSL
jgi:hypothetical protein